jgi:tryptophan synthase alpha chain
MTGAERIEGAIRAANASGRAAVVGFVTGGYPSRSAFGDVLRSVASACDVVEVGVPFSDPMADGVTIQRASERALQDGTTLTWLLESVGSVAQETPLVFMSYLNPVLQFGLERFGAACADAEVAGLIVPDLPFEECTPVREPLDAHGVALIQLVTPATPADRLRMLCDASRGFVYAVTMMGTTGAAVVDGTSVGAYLTRVRGVSELPVLAGFGIRTPEDVKRVGPHAHGVIVGSAVIESIERGEDPGVLLQSLVRAATESGLTH